MEDWKKSFDDGKFVVMVVMDLLKVFDSFFYLLFISKLWVYGLDNSSCVLL